MRRDDKKAQAAGKKQEKFIEGGENFVQRVEALEDRIGEKRRNGVETRQRQKYEQKCQEQAAAPIVGKIRDEIRFQQFTHKSPSFLRPLPPSGLPRNRSGRFAALHDLEKRIFQRNLLQ